MDNKNLKKHFKRIIAVICVLALTIQGFSGYSNLISRASDSVEPVQIVFNDATKMGADEENRPLYSGAFLTAGANTSIVTDSDSGKTYMKTETTSADPQYWLYFNGLCESGTLDLDAYPYVKISYRNMSSTATWDSAYIMAFSDAFNDHIQYEFYPYDTDSAEGNGSWNEVILDMNALKASYTVTPNNGTTLAKQQNSWTGKSSQIRFDFTGRNEIEIDIEYIAFFANKEAAESYTGESADEKTETIGSHLKGITAHNFGVADGTYKFTEEGMPKKGYEVNGLYAESLENTYFSADVEFSSVTGASLHYGGGESVWHGIRLDIMWDGSMRVNRADFNEAAGDKIYYLYTETAGVKLTDTKYNLKLTTEFVDSDNDGAKDDVKFGIWFNDVLYNQEYLYFANLATSLGGNLTICSSQENPESYIFIASDTEIKPEPDPEPEPGEPEAIGSHLKGITAHNFGVADGKYKFTEEGMPKKGYEVTGLYEGSLENTYFSADVEFSSITGASLHYGGGESVWHGIRLDIMWDGSMRVNRADFDEAAGDKIYYLYTETAGVKLTDTKYNLKLTTEFVDSDNDGAKDDVKFGIWFNDVLYNQEYLYFANLATSLGGNLTICSSQENPESYISIASDTEIKPEPKPEKPNKDPEVMGSHLKGITVHNFGIADGTYRFTKIGTLKNGYEANGLYKGSLKNTYFSANVKFSSETGASLHYGGGESVWHGIRLDIMWDGSMRVNRADFDAAAGDKIYYLYSDIAGVKLTDTKYNLKLTTEYVDSDKDGAKDDVKFGIWFNDVLYNQEYIYFPNLATSLGSNLTICASQDNPNSYIYVQSDSKIKPEPKPEPKTIGSHLTGITARDFGIADGKYKFTEAGTLKQGYEASGKYAFSLENTYFSAEVEFSSKIGASLHYGGGESVWHGIRLDIMWDGSMRVNRADFNEAAGDKIYYLYSDIAGVKLTDTKYNLKLTTEYVDSDKDGKKDDVKFGIWFNDVLYNQEYIYFPNLATGLGSSLTICASQDNPKSYIFVKSDSKIKTVVDFSLYGFTKNWNKELGKEI